MDLNTIEIPDLLIRELYRDNLLATVATPLSKESSIPGTVPARNAPMPSATAPTAPTPPTATAPTATPPTATRAQTTPTPQAAPTAPIPAYKYLGKNQRQITIVIQSPGIAFLPDDQLTVLTKMLEACRMNIGDVAIVNHANTPVAITTLRDQLHPSIILLFGIQPVDIRLPINFPVFKIQAYDDCTYLCAPTLSELVPATEESKLLKSKLWVCLKTLFAV